MRRVLVALIVVSVLTLPTVARPPSAQAACIDSPTQAVLTVLFAGAPGLISILACDPFSPGPPAECPITAVSATARRDEQGAIAHGFDYRFTDFCGGIRTVGGFSERTGEVSETMTGNGRTVRAIWRCTSDPWIYTTGSRPSCIRDSITLTGDPAGWDAGAASQATFPLSAGLLATISRQTLNGQLQNAIRQLPPVTPPTPTPTPAPAPRLLETVRLGSTNAQLVTAVQYFLRHHGHMVTVDGDFGPQTDGAVRAFQAAKGITVDGIVGRQTWEKFWVTLQSGRYGSAVRALQTLLNRQGATLAVDGFFGAQTTAAVRAFQQRQGLTVDGIVGPFTWEALCARIIHLNPRPLP